MFVRFKGMPLKILVSYALIAVDTLNVLKMYGDPNYQKDESKILKVSNN